MNRLGSPSDADRQRSSKITLADPSKGSWISSSKKARRKDLHLVAIAWRNDVDRMFAGGSSDRPVRSLTVLLSDDFSGQESLESLDRPKVLRRRMLHRLLWQLPANLFQWCFICS